MWTIIDATHAPKLRMSGRTLNGLSLSTGNDIAGLGALRFLGGLRGGIADAGAGMRGSAIGELFCIDMPHSDFTSFRSLGGLENPRTAMF